MSTVDTSCFSWRDAADIALQRTQHLLRFPALGPISYRAWRNSFPHLLHLEARLRKKVIFSGALKDAEREFQAISAYLGDREIHRAIDIGCGHALIDLFVYRRYRCDIHLVDIERTESRQHEWQNSGSGYASLSSGKRFLVNNGVPAGAVKTTNPSISPLQDESCELILSLLSAGFHYPVSEYAGYAYRSLRPSGVFIFDARKGQHQEDELRRFSKIDVLFDGPKHQRLAAVR